MDKKAPSLTDRQKQVLKILHGAITHRGVVPTLQELQDELGFKSSRGVVCHLMALEKKGFVRREGGARGIRLLKFLKQGKTQANVSYLPLVGNVAAGTPILAEENIEEWVPVASSMVHCKRAFLLRVKGDSMVGAHILDGDLLVVCPEHSPEQNDIVVALIDDEATVKRYRKSGPSIELKAENPKYKSIHISAGARMVIQGKVVGVLRMGQNAAGLGD